MNLPLQPLPCRLALTRSVGVIYILETCWMSSSVSCWFDNAPGSEFGGADLFTPSHICYGKHHIIYWKVKICYWGVQQKAICFTFLRVAHQGRMTWNGHFLLEVKIVFMWSNVWVGWCLSLSGRLEWIMLFGDTVGRALPRERDQWLFGWLGS